MPRCPMKWKVAPSAYAALGDFVVLEHALCQYFGITFKSHGAPWQCLLEGWTIEIGLTIKAAAMSSCGGLGDALMADIAG